MHTGSKKIVFVLIPMVYLFSLAYAKMPGEDGGGVQILGTYDKVKVINKLKYPIEIILNPDASIEHGERKVEGILVSGENEHEKDIGGETIVEKLLMRVKNLKNITIADSGNMIINWANENDGEINGIFKDQEDEVDDIDINFKREGDRLVITVGKA